jgi:chromosomal replication initiator protein
MRFDAEAEITRDQQITDAIITDERIYKESENQNDLWPKVISVLEKRLGKQIVAAWLKNLNFSVENSSLYQYKLICPNKFAADHVRVSYQEDISAAISDLLDCPKDLIELNFSVISITKTLQLSKSPQFNNTADIAANSIMKIASRSGLNNRSGSYSGSNTVHIANSKNSSNLNPAYNFSNFVVGQCNQFANAVALQITQNSSGSTNSSGLSINPLFIYGGVGLGKTHLVNAIGNASIRRGKNVLLVSSEGFVNELISSIRTNKMQDFKNKFRSLDLLIVDDIQFIIGKERTEEEFFHTFNELYQKRKQIIITSDKLPKDMVGLEDRLKTRFACGLSTDLQSPDYETRVAIVQKKATLSNIALPTEVAQYLAEMITSNVRELEGALNRVLALAHINRREVTVELATDAIASYVTTPSPQTSVEEIQRTVAESLGVSINDLLGKRRSQNIALARHIAMHLCRRITGFSYPELGAFFGGREHSTVIHACKLIDEKLLTDQNLKKKMDSLFTACSSRNYNIIS